MSESTEIVQPSSSEDFEKIISGSGNTLIVVDFYADWCGPCRMIAPYVKELANEYSGSVIFVKVNVDENGDIAEKYGISGIPAFLFFKQGKKVNEFSGASKDKLKSTVENLK